MPSPLTIITNALRDIRVLSANDSAASGEDTELALSHYNEVVEELVALGLGWYEVNEAFTFGVSQQSYSIAPVGTTPASGVFVMTATGVRPPRFSRAKLVLVASSPDTEYEIPIVTVGQYENIVQPAQSAAEPQIVYYQPTFPNGTLWPVPYPTTTTNQLRLFWKNQLSSIDIADISTSISMPPGVSKALKYELMRGLAGAFGKSLTADQMVLAQESWKTLLTMKNADPAYIATDIAGASAKTAQNWNPNNLRSYL